MSDDNCELIFVFLSIGGLGIRTFGLLLLRRFLVLRLLSLLLEVAEEAVVALGD